jgi:hypothetical protein
MSSTVFYAWQSDTDEATNHHFIAAALKSAIAQLNVELLLKESEAGALTLDRDTHNEPGMPAVADTLLRKIDGASAFVADLTYVADIPHKDKRLPNANVGIELGYAARAIGFDRMICVFNAHFGSPSRLPFDLVHRRFPVQYTLSPASTSDEKRAQLSILTEALTKALRLIVEKLGLNDGTEVDDIPPHAAARLNESTFILNGSIAQTRSYDEEGRENDNVYWHHGPCAWLRLVPASSKNFRSAQLVKLVGTGAPPLRPFGETPRCQFERNRFGVVAIGYDEKIPAIAMELTQVFFSGELWGLNHALIEPERTHPTRTFQIPWPETERLFQQTLAGYLDFAKRVLELSLPITAVAGLGMVDQAMFVPAKQNWYLGTPRSEHCHEQFILSRISVTDWDTLPAVLLESFFGKVLDACGQDYAEWRKITWPKN